MHENAWKYIKEFDLLQSPFLDGQIMFTTAPEELYLQIYRYICSQHTWNFIDSPVPEDKVFSCTALSEHENTPYVPIRYSTLIHIISFDISPKLKISISKLNDLGYHPKSGKCAWVPKRLEFFAMCQFGDRIVVPCNTMIVINHDTNLENRQGKWLLVQGKWLKSDLKWQVLYFFLSSFKSTMIQLPEKVTGTRTAAKFSCLWLISSYQPSFNQIDDCMKMTNPSNKQSQ